MRGFLSFSPVAGYLRRAYAWVLQGNRRTWVGALLLYVVVVSVYVLVAPRDLLTEHTAYNHYAHLAHAWLHGRLDLANGPPEYAHNNDFAHYHERWFVAFPPFPAVVLLPFVALAKEPELVRDGQIFLWLSGLAPVFLFLALERLRSRGHAPRSTFGNWCLALCFACGSVFFSPHSKARSGLPRTSWERRWQLFICGQQSMPASHSWQAWRWVWV